MANRLHGKRCLIVGGTTGIGFAAAIRFVQEGGDLVVAGLEDNKGPLALQELQRYGNAHFHPCNAAKEHEVESLFDRTRQLLGGNVK